MEFLLCKETWPRENLLRLLPLCGRLLIPLLLNIVALLALDALDDLDALLVIEL
jgi:hypothetical protein